MLIDDDEEEYFLLKELVSGQAKGRTLHHYDLDWVSTYEEAVRAFLSCQYDVYLVDYHLGSRSGLDLLREAASSECSSPIIMLTGQGSYETDVSAMQLGAADYLEKNQLTLPLLERSIRYAIEQKQAAQQLEQLVHERTSDLAVMQKQAQELAADEFATRLLKRLEPRHPDACVQLVYVFAVLAEPTPAWISVPGLLIFTGIVLFLASVHIRRMEISYAGE